MWLCPPRARVTWAGGGPQWCHRLVQGWGRFICERDGGILTPLFLPRAFTKLIFGKAKAKATWVSEAAPGQIALSVCRTPELCPRPFQQSPIAAAGTWPSGAKSPLPACVGSGGTPSYQHWTPLSTYPELVPRARCAAAQHPSCWHSSPGLPSASGASKVTPLGQPQLAATPCPVVTAMGLLGPSRERRGHLIPWTGKLRAPS